MQKLTLSAVLFAAIAAGTIPAGAQTAPTQTVNAPNSSNNGISNPVGQNTNVQVNNSYAGMNSFGVGIECATPYVAAGVYNNNTAVNNGVVGIQNNAGSNNSLGGTLQFVLPIGGRQQSNCTALSSEILHQRQLDTQITLIQRCADFAKGGISLDPKVYPELASACVGVHVAASAPASTSMLPQVETVTVPKLVVYKEPAVPVQKCAGGYHALNARDKRLTQAWRDSLKRKLTKTGAKLAAEYLRELESDCVSPVALMQALDAQ